MGKGVGISKPKFIGRVLDAIFKLSEKHGSSAKNILNFVLKNSKTINRNLTLQIQHALKRAVKEGLIELVGSRYKLRREKQKQEAAAQQKDTEPKPTSNMAPPAEPPKKVKKKKRSKAKKSSTRGRRKEKGSSGKPSSDSESKTNEKNPSVK